MKNTWILFVDELNGFAKSAVMIGMWIGMPFLGITLYFLLPTAIPVNGIPGNFSLPASTFLAIALSSTMGLLAATLVSIEIVNDKNRKVYDFFLIRPINRGHFMWAKFFAISLCVTISLAFSMGAGVLIDLIRGVEISPLMRETLFDKFLSGVGVVIISTAAGILIGMISNTVLMAVMLVWFIGQYVMFIPMLAAFIDIGPVKLISWALTVVITVLLMVFSALIFRRMEV